MAPLVQFNVAVIAARNLRNAAKTSNRLPVAIPEVAQPFMLDIGQKIADRYRIDKLIGAGGMGLVYQGLDTQTYERVAIKVLNPRVLLSKTQVARFYRECRALMALKHPHIVDVIDITELDNGAPVLVTELLIGRDLRQEVIERGPLPIKEAVGYMQQAAGAVAAAHHASVIHRDIKPSNFFVTQQSEMRRVKLLDFGISKFRSVTDEETVTQTDAVLGTPHYMSPEQILSTHDVDERTDIWSLGVVFFYLLTEDLPFRGLSPSAIIAAIPVAPPICPREFRPDITEALEQVILHCLEKNPDNRYASADEFGAALTTFGPKDGLLYVDATLPSSLPPVTPPHFGYPPLLPPKPIAERIRQETPATPIFKQTVADVPSEKPAKEKKSSPAAQPAGGSRDRQAVLRGARRWLAVALVVVTVGAWFWFKAQRPTNGPSRTTQVSGRSGETRAEAPPTTDDVKPANPDSVGTVAATGDTAATSLTQSSPDGSAIPATFENNRGEGVSKTDDTRSREQTPDIPHPATKRRTPKRAKPPSARPKPSASPARPPSEKPETRPLFL